MATTVNRMTSDDIRYIVDAVVLLGMALIAGGGAREARRARGDKADTDTRLERLEADE